MDSTTSFRSSSNRRVSNLYNSSPLKNSSTSEHLLCGFAQVVGSFVVDSNLINLNEFDPLKHYNMYNPQGGFNGGGGGLMVAKTDSSLGNVYTIKKKKKKCERVFNNDMIIYRCKNITSVFNTSFHFICGLKFISWRN
jgi:hypothetical protein